MIEKMIFPVLVVLVTLCGHSRSIEAPKLEDLLVDNLEPELYDLEIFTDLMNPKPKFWGTVRIKVKCIFATNTIILNYESKVRIEKHKVKIKTLPASASVINVVKLQFDDKNTIFNIILLESLEKDKNYLIEIEFPEKPFKSVCRYKRRSYKTDEQIAYTDVDYNSSVGMETVFPCFVKLDVKVKFKIRHGHLNTLTAISNAIFRSNTESTYAPNWVIDEFEETISMPMYNLVIALSDLQSAIVSDPSLKTEIRIFANEVVLTKVEYMKKTIARIINFFLEYFKIQIPFEKLDIIVLGDEVSMASVSYGVIYFSEDIILSKLPIMNSFDEFQIVSEMCHVISKQWIGSAVALLPPSHRVLHIGLNIFLQTLCVKNINPEWEVTFLEPNIINSFTDSLELMGYAEYNNYFLPRMGITYILYNEFGDYVVERVYHLMRMTHFLLGPDLFRKSIRDYIDRYQSTYSSMEDLWNTFTNNIDSVYTKRRLSYFSIEQIMNPWTKQVGFPLVTVTRNDDNSGITISQEPFDCLFDQEGKRQRINNIDMYNLVLNPEENQLIVDKEKEYEKQSTRCWLIPLSFATKTKPYKDTIAIQWLNCDGPQELIIDNLNENDWILFDPTVTVIGRVNYDTENWLAIQKSLANKDESAAFDPLTRGRLISDMLNLAGIGRLSFTIVFDTIKYLPQEDNYEHWRLVLNWFRRNRFLFFKSSFFESFQKYVRSLLEPMFQKKKYKNMIEFEHSDHPNNAMKLLIIESSCKFGVKSCHRRSLQLIDKWKNQQGPPDLIPEELLDIILCEGIKHGKKWYRNYLWGQYAKATENSIRTSILNAFGCSEDSKFLESYLQLSITEGKMLPGDSSVAFNSLSTNKIGYKAMKTFVLNNFKAILSFRNDDKSAFANYLSDLLEVTVKREDLKELIKFAEERRLLEKNFPNLKVGLKSAIRNIEWLEKHEKELEGYFNKGISSKLKLFWK